MATTAQATERVAADPRPLYARTIRSIERTGWRPDATGCLLAHLHWSTPATTDWEDSPDFHVAVRHLASLIDDFDPGALAEHHRDGAPLEDERWLVQQWNDSHTRADVVGLLARASEAFVVPADGALPTPAPREGASGVGSGLSADTALREVRS